MIRKIKETCLYVQDLDRSQSFYHDLLGLPVIEKKANKHVFFRAGTSVLLCFLPDDSGSKTDLPPHWASGSIHLAFEVSTADYESWKQKVRGAGIEIIHEQSWGDYLMSFYFKDPDGHLLEIVQEGMWDG